MRRAPTRSCTATCSPKLAHARGWEVHCYDAKHIEAQAADLLGERAEEVLRGPRATLGPPWTKDHRVALAATVLAGDGLLSDVAPTGLKALSRR